MIILETFLVSFVIGSQEPALLSEKQQSPVNLPTEMEIVRHALFKLMSQVNIHVLGHKREKNVGHVKLYFVDEEAPVITCVSNQLIITDKGMDTAMDVWEGPKASDYSGNVSRIICNPQSGTRFTIGKTTVTCESTEGNGNRAACSFQVNVTGKYSYTWA